jgi:hypothetical protein
MGILGCNLHLPRSSYSRDVDFLQIRSLWCGAVQYFILVSRHACRDSSISDCGEEDSRQVDRHTRHNRAEPMVRHNLGLASHQ